VSERFFWVTKHRVINLRYVRELKISGQETSSLVCVFMADGEKIIYQICKSFLEAEKALESLAIEICPELVN
jgi:hypothetical protein